MLAHACACSVLGVEARPVRVEVHLSKGLPGFELVGLAEATVRESRVRVRAALTNSGFALPPRRVVLNLAPAGVRKRGSSFDLSIAVALLAASGSCPTLALEDTLLFGELSLGGELRMSPGLLPQLRYAHAAGLRRAIVPAAQLPEAALFRTVQGGVEVFGAHNLESTIAFLRGGIELPTAQMAEPEPPASTEVDLVDVRGQGAAKRALEVSAAGGHHLLMSGPPGAGKTMLAERLASILPPLSPDQALEIATIRSAVHRSFQHPFQRPFRAPHHSTGPVALVGGGRPIRPGEVSLAHLGVLFLDELPEFSRSASEALRTVMESGVARVSRADEHAEMPARPLVVAAMNPCPCGFEADPSILCVCAPHRIEAYRARVSGPILDRFALHIEVPRINPASFASELNEPAETSSVVRARVVAARDRLAKAPAVGGLESRLASLTPRARDLTIKAVEKWGLSMRGADNALSVARTIAALDGDELRELRVEHVSEAISYRARRVMQDLGGKNDVNQGTDQGGQGGDRYDRETVREGSDHGPGGARS